MENENAAVPLPANGYRKEEARQGREIQPELRRWLLGVREAVNTASVRPINLLGLGHLE